MLGLPSWFETIIRYYPTYQIGGGASDEWENIDWNGFEPIPQSVISAYRFVYAQELKIKDFSINCEFTIITSGFVSSALGAEYKYASNTANQLNLLGSIIVSSPLNQIPLAVNLVSTGESSFELHTYAQLRTVVEDLSTFKIYWYETFNNLRLQINAAETIEELDALIWPGLDPDDY